MKEGIGSAPGTEANASAATPEEPSAGKYKALPSGWRPIESAPHNETVLILTRAKRIFKAFLAPGASENEHGSCDQWTADDEYVCPPCWTDGGCWESNADEEPSDQPTHWQPLPPPPDVLERSDANAHNDLSNGAPSAPPASMVEKVARAAYAARTAGGIHYVCWDALGPKRRGYELAAARAAILAMRTPTDEMLSEADSAIPRFEAPLDGHRLMGTDGAEIVWQAMIDEALNEA